MLSEKEKAERYDLVVGYFQKILNERADELIDELVCYDECRHPRHLDDVERQEEVTENFIYEMDNIGFFDFAELMARNGGNGIWLSPEQALEAGLVDVVIKPNTSVASSLVERVAQWLGLKPKKEEGQITPPTDRVNMVNRVPHCSSITLSEGQATAKPSLTKAVEDPDIHGAVLSANAEAYNRDVAAFRQ
mgnify:CR=1 FL=1